MQTWGHFVDIRHKLGHAGGSANVCLGCSALGGFFPPLSEIRLLAEQSGTPTASKSKERFSLSGVVG